jgi:RND superfamily putative drug exporter
MTAPQTPAVAPEVPTESSKLVRLSRWAQHHRRLALALWLVVLAGTIAISSVVGDAFYDDHRLPGTESQALVDLLEERGLVQAGDTIQLVFTDPGGVESEPARQRVGSLLANVADLPSVVGVDDPYQSPGAISADGTVGFATVILDGQIADIPVADVRTIIDTTQAADGDGLEFALGGEAVRTAEAGEGGGAEGAGTLAALVILVFMFGSLLAASVPLITAIFAVGTTLSVMVLASHVITLPTYLPPLMMLVGLGVGIDYALLIFARWRSEILAGATRQQAADLALDKAGRSVLFAGCVVIVALLGLYALGLGPLQAVALGVALTVLVTMIAAVTLLPALLSMFGRRIERRVRARAAKAKREPGHRWRRWAGFIEHRPWTPLALVLAGLILLSLPALGMRLGFSDAGSESESHTSRVAYDRLAEGFGPGFNGPLVVVSEGDESVAGAAASAIGGIDGVDQVTPAQQVGPGLWLSLVMSDSGPQDEQTAELVHTLRDDVLAAQADQTGATYWVGGASAAAIDFADAVEGRLLLFLLIVVGVSTLLLVVMFRSVWIPVKAAVLNLLTISASLGVVTLIFQRGALGFQPGPIEAFVPVMVFAIVFGLSMDYEVFLVSRMREHWQRTGDARAAVRDGLANTAGVITAAAAVMMVVFGAFILSDTRMLQQFGLGLAVAIFLDAVVIRCLVVPSVMRLLGRHAWWVPRWLDRVLPPIGGSRGPGRPFAEEERPVASPVG